MIKDCEPDLVQSARKLEVLAYLTDYKDAFLKEYLDVLSLHQSIDHKIELTADNTLGFCYLNKQSMEELTAMQDYLYNNLGKGFIVKSKALFVSLVLFTCKPDRSLCFCVDYCKLNTLTKKNWYSLPLIDKTLAQLSKAKIFTKLDICYVFYQIWISSESEELTAFWTCYRLF